MFCNWLYPTRAGTELFGALWVCLNRHAGLKCKLTHGFIPWMSPSAYIFACSNLKLLWLKSGVNKLALLGRNLKLRRGGPLFRLVPIGLRSSWLYELKLQFEVRCSCGQRNSSPHLRHPPDTNTLVLPLPLGPTQILSTEERGDSLLKTTLQKMRLKSLLRFLQIRSPMSIAWHVGTHCPLPCAGRQELPLKQEVINAENRI